MVMRELRRRLMLMIGRAVITAIRADGGRVLLDLGLLAGESAEGVELAEPSGLTSIPLEGAEAVTLSLMGDRSHRVALPLGDRRHRPRDGQPGETILFDDQGQRIAIKRDRIEIVSSKPIIIQSPTIAIEAGSATINDRAIATVGDVIKVDAGSSAGRWPIVTGVGSDE